MSILIQSRWPSLAQDLAIMTVPGSPIPDFNFIHQVYGTTDDELKEIIKIPEFQQMYKSELDRCKAQGSRAGQIYRFSSLSQALSEKLYRDATTGIMEAKDALKLLELLMKAAGLSDDKSTQVNTQVNVGVALPLPKNLDNPKLKHLEAVDV